MRWTVVIPGQPPSVNHSYKPVMLRKRTATGEAYTRMGIAKLSSVTDYQTAVVQLTRTAMPSRWRPAGDWVRVTYRFFLKRSIDFDNAMKALNDAIALAIGVNDRRFLPCVISASIDPKESNPRVEVGIADEPSDSPSSRAAPSRASRPSRSSSTS